MPPKVDISKPLRPPLNEVPIHIPPSEAHSKNTVVSSSLGPPIRTDDVPYQSTPLFHEKWFVHKAGVWWFCWNCGSYKSGHVNGFSAPNYLHCAQQNTQFQYKIIFEFWNENKSIWHSVGMLGFFCYSDITWNQFWGFYKVKMSAIFAFLEELNFNSCYFSALQK